MAYASDIGYYWPTKGPPLMGFKCKYEPLRVANDKILFFNSLQLQVCDLCGKHKSESFVFLREEGRGGVGWSEYETWHIHLTWKA